MQRFVALWLILLVFSNIGFSKGAKRSTRSRAAEPTVVWDPALINDAASMTPADQKTRPLAILRTQILLDRAHFSPGEIDGQPGPNFQRALSAFQQSRNIAASGNLDEATWQALNTDTTTVLAPYRITEQEVAGPFEKIPADMMEQAKLKSLGYESAVEALGEQFHVSPTLLQRLNPGKTFAAGEEITVPNVLTSVTGKATRIVVSKAGTLQVFDASGGLIAHYPCSSGSEHDPLPIGQWKINGVAKNPPFHYNPKLFWDANPGHSKAKLPPGPNNPVGVVWIDLSKEHYGIHGTPAPNKVGHTQSHGCIRLTNWDAMELASLVSPGIPAVLQE